MNNKTYKTIEDHKKTIEIVNSCWIWRGAIDSRGYGQLRSRGKTWRAHRYFYSELVGEIPKGLQIDHLCKNRLCVNPVHLEAVSQTENIRRSGAWDNNRSKTHCPQGHEYTEENTSFRQNRRTCISCRREKGREYMRRKRLTNKQSL